MHLSRMKTNKKMQRTKRSQVNKKVKKEAKRKNHLTKKM